MFAGAAFLLDETLEVFGNLELLTAIPTASVDRDNAVAVHDAHLIEVRKHNERAANPVVGHGVIVEVEANVGCLSDLDFDSLVCREGLGGQWQ